MKSFQQTQPENFPDPAERKQRQQSYYARIQTLESADRQAYMNVFNRISQIRAVDTEVAHLLDESTGSASYSLLRELVAIVEEAVSARERGDYPLFQSMTLLLEDISVAVNALVNRQCLCRSRRMVAHYRNLQRMARSASLN